MASATQSYIDKYSAQAMSQMEKYGIPASITLAQGILESANGQSQLARNENNHFGIKASKSWLDGGGKYGLYTDDAKNEKFCSYASVGDSYEHHSKFLKNNARYAGCFKLSADDYQGWANGLQRAGYATNRSYAQSLIAVIERNGLAKYDRMVMQGQYVAQTETKSEDKQQVQSQLQPQSQAATQQLAELTKENGNAETQDDEWKKMLSSEESKYAGADPVMDMVVGMFTPLAAIATALDNGETVDKQSIKLPGGLNAAELASRNFEQNLNSQQQSNNSLKLS
jgi:hypothetical protein